MFLSLSVPKKDQKSVQAQLVKRRKTMGKPLGPSHYVLSEQQMEKYDYPLYVLDENGDKRCPAGYVETVSPGEILPCINTEKSESIMTGVL